MGVTVAEMAAHLRRREAEAHDRAAARERRILARLADARELLRMRYGASRVWLFGSLATGTFTEWSDVDFAVEGLPAEAYFDALATLMERLEVRVDLVRVEDAVESLRERIRAEGREL